MFLKLEKNRLNNITFDAVTKAKNIRNLQKITNISKSTISRYLNEQTLATKNNIQKLLNYTNSELKNSWIIKEIPKNWRQIKGGRKCVKLKKEKGNFTKQLKKFQKAGLKQIKNWHKRMKKENPEEYYKSQYEKFKKVGTYKFKTKRGEKVRNKLEKDIADILYERKINYDYEPFIKINKKGFFPDFLINKKIILECTAWRGTDKAIKLKEKIRHLSKKYRVYVIIPKTLNSYYKILNKYLILGLEKFVPVAQTFPCGKT